MIIPKPGLKWDVEFRCRLLRLWFEAQAECQFPSTIAANLFRGALGTALTPSLFRPQLPSGPSGLFNPPRPFVLRARHLDGRTAARGERINLNVHFFAPIATQLTEAFQKAPPFHGALPLAAADPEKLLTFPLAPLGTEANRVTIAFLTPTELKTESGLAPEPTFPILFARAAGRLRTLAALYNPEAPLDFTYLVPIAEQIRLTGHTLTYESARRLSTRTGQSHPLGGFTGEAHYEGDLHELLPVLQAASFTGVGRQTVWGKGEFVLKR